MTRLVVLLVSACLLPAAEVALRLPERVRPESAFRFEVVVSDPPADLIRIDPPDVAWFRCERNGNVTSHTRVNADGSRTQVISLGFHGLVSEEGRRDVPAFTVAFSDGSSATSPPTAIEAGPGDASLVGQAMASVRWEPASAVPGQTVQLCFEVALRDDLNLAVIDEQGLSSEGLGLQIPTGLSLGAMQPVSAASTIDAEGNAWTRTTYSFPCTALAAGSYTVGGQQNFYQRRGLIGYRRAGAIPIKPATLEVVDFPAEGRPPGFAGLIGPLEIEASLDRSTIRMGEGAVYELRVRGRGLEVLLRPDDPASAGLRARFLEAADLPAEGQRPAGRLFRWNITPQRVGQLDLPAIGFHAFDAATLRYEHALSPALRLEVLAGREATARPAPAAEGGTATPALNGLPPLALAAGPAPSAIQVLLVALLAGLAGALVPWWLGRIGNDAARLRRAAWKAWTTGDWPALEQALHQAGPRLTGASRTGMQEVQDAVATARYGGPAPEARMGAVLRAALAELDG